MATWKVDLENLDQGSGGFKKNDPVGKRVYGPNNSKFSNTKIL